MPERTVLLALALAAVSGLLGLLFPRRSPWGQRLTTLVAVAAGSLGLAGVAHYWQRGDSEAIVYPWNLLPGAEFHVLVDGLSAVFLVPIFAVFLLGSIYGLGYWRQAEYPDSGRKLRVFYGFLAAGMAVVVVARNAILFIFGWEVMALSAFFLVATEDERADVRAAGWLYLVATHTATLSLFATFMLFRAASGSYDLVPIATGAATPAMLNSIFGLALLGFGIKAGIMPLHVWLPTSHAMAPSHVSAIMSGVIIKMGVYGLVRMSSLLPLTVEWGVIVLGLGAISAVLGVAFAIGQQDLKRLLAYSSIENIGIVFLGLGLAMLGRSLERPDLVVLGLAGALLHVVNHSFFKSMLFLAAGSVIHATHTRDIDLLGGLSKRMRWTALAFVIGAVAICGLPPLNGFVSEFVIYLGLFGTLGADHHALVSAVAFGAPVLAFVGALAVACFVRAYGVVFLGVPRTAPASHAHESPPSILFALAVLALGCMALGLYPPLAVLPLGQAVQAWAPDIADATADLERLVPWQPLSTLALSLAAGLAAVGTLLWTQLGRSRVHESVTWGCGYQGGTPRIQYTSSSFGEMLVGLFSWALRPRIHLPFIKQLFPQESYFRSHVPDPVLDEAVVPGLYWSANLLAWFRVFQQGSIHLYLTYIFAALLVLLLIPQ
ncbi:MAG TPA: proton-conducting transporter membrane subunit [Pirellulales bacterium]|jgi:hydrogenase-4 component B|nr:proton-conducting transporter membrane subunit [Pirellulales bacterium]